jgi:hypothetical protein
MDPTAFGVRRYTAESFCFLFTTSIRCVTAFSENCPFGLKYTVECVDCRCNPKTGTTECSDEECLYLESKLSILNHKGIVVLNF